MRVDRNILKQLLPVFILTGSVTVSVAQTATYNDQISCILFEHCTTCHHSGGIAPFSLMTYDDATAAAIGMQDAVNAETMPPWSPDPEYSELAHARLLSQQEIDLINDWVNGGYPEGAGTPPQPPVYDNVENITDPDLVLTMPLYTINTANNDDYRCFVLPTGLTEEIYVTAIELVAGNPEAVHHATIYQDSTDIPEQLDAADPDPGYTSFGGSGSSSSEFVGGWAPGVDPAVYPVGMGVKVPVGSDLIIQLHYPMSANGLQDQTKVNIRYTTTPVREVTIAHLLHQFDLNEGPLIIPPDQVTTFTSEFTVPPQSDLTFLGIGPHMHLLGRSISSYCVTPSDDTIPLVSVPEWDFHWQGFYDFKSLVRIPAGSTLYGSATYDNTTDNPENPNDPPQTVFGGESTNEEMMLIFFSFTPYQLGDENIVIEADTEHDSHVCQLITGSEEMEEPDFRIFPNPASDRLWFDRSDKDANLIRLTNTLGQTVADITNPDQGLDVSQIPNGIYLVSVSTDSEIATQKVVIRH